MGLSAISLFSGAGGLDIAAKACGIRTVCYVENDRYAQAVLVSRMRDGSLDDAPLWDDVTTFDGKPWRGKVDIVFGGFPCQPHSVAGKRKGSADERNLWPDFLRIVRECRPGFVVAENVLGIFDTGYAIKVLADLEELGFCATPFSSSACSFGFPHPRGRVFFMAHAKGIRFNGGGQQKSPPRCLETGGRCFDPIRDKDLIASLARASNGMAGRLDRIRLCGNGVVPQQAVPAFEKLKEWAGL